MRDGELVGILDKEDISAKTVVPMMLGKEASHIDVASGDVKRYEDNKLEVRGLQYKALLRDVNFDAYGGEVLGIGGLVGSGRTELLKCIYGSLPARWRIRNTQRRAGEQIGRKEPEKRFRVRPGRPTQRRLYTDALH